MRRSHVDLVFMVLAGSLWHFVYVLCGRAWIVGLMAPINESVWEHLKLAFGATLLLLPVDLWRRRRGVPMSVLGRALGIIAADVIIVIGFYAYTWIIGRSILAIDITLYVVGCWAAVWLHERSANGNTDPSVNALGWIVVALLAVLFGSITYHPPTLGIFIPAAP